MKSKSLKAKKRLFKVFELEIPKKYYPKVTNNKTKEYANKARDIMLKLHDIETDLELCLMNIKDYKKIIDSRHKAKRPISYDSRHSLYMKIRKFNDEYENYCLRIYIYRETIWHFLADFLDVKNEGFFSFLKDSKIRDLKLDKVLSLFDKNELKEVIGFRNKITHKLPQTDLEKDKGLSDLIKKFDNDVKIVNKSLLKILKINQKIVLILNNFKEETCKVNDSVKK